MAFAYRSGFSFPVPPCKVSGFDGRYDYVLAQVGCFGVDENRQFVEGNGQLKYLNPDVDLMLQDCDLNLDLNVGFDETIQKVYEPDKGLDFLLKWITLNRNYLTTEVQFVTNRYVLRTIAETSYENSKADWIISACKFRGVIYLDSVLTRWNDVVTYSEKNKKFDYWNAKFKNYLTTDRSGRSDTVANVNEEFYSVVRSRLNDNSMLFAGEMDAMDIGGCPPDSTEKAMKTDEYVLFRTRTGTGDIASNEKFIRERLLKRQWVHSTLSGCVKNFVGFRDDNGVIQKIEMFETRNILNLQRCWSHKVLMNSLDKFLNYLKAAVVDDNPKVVYKFHLRHKEKVIRERFEGEEFQLLPAWYIDSFSEGS